jgi:hypothetical protein
MMRSSRHSVEKRWDTITVIDPDSWRAFGRGGGKCSNSECSVGALRLAVAP